MANAATAENVKALMSEAKRLWYLQFSTEVSARYHDWRRASLGTAVSVVRAVSLLGAIISVVAVQLANNGAMIATIACAIIALVTLWDLVFQIDDKARKHTDLYKRFKTLQESIAKNQDDWQTHIADWEAQAHAIRRDEPDTFWAIYATSWNQTIDREQADRSYMRKVSRWKAAIGGLRKFRPEDFPYANGVVAAT